MPSSACCGRVPDLHSFPTRRSSDLRRGRAQRRRGGLAYRRDPGGTRLVSFLRRRRGHGPHGRAGFRQARSHHLGHRHRAGDLGGLRRSEEHTSELQSPCNLVCRLLLAAAASQTSTLSLHDALPIFAAGVLSAVAAALHIGVILGGPAWYRFFGAGEGMARMAERGSAKPALITLGIAIVLAIWAAYADRKSTRLNSSHLVISYAVFCLLRPRPRPPLFPYTTLFRSSPRACSAPSRRPCISA